MISRIDHISIAVNDYEKARHFFQNVLGAIPGAGDANREKNFFWQMFSLGDLSRLELIYPTGEGGLLDKFLDRKAGGLHHITMQTPDIQKARQVLKDNDVPCFGYHEYGDVWKEIFVHPKDAFGVLIQIAEFNPDDWLDRSLVLSKKKWAVAKSKKGGILTFAHPGGGKVQLELSKEEVKMLVRDLDQCC